MKKRTFILSVLGLMMSFGSMKAATVSAESGDDTIYVAQVAMPGEHKTPEITLEGTGASATVVVSAADLKNDVSITATSGFSVSQSTLRAGEDTKITITNTTYRKKNVGKVIMRSGDYRAYVNLVSYGSDLAVKAALDNKFTPDEGDQLTFEGFAPQAGKGYTVEIRAKVDDASKTLEPFAVTDEGVGFKGYVSSTGTGLYNGYGSFVSQESMSNPSNGGTFYNTDGLYHTYRYVVTPDERVIVYRDGITIDSLRVADLGHQPEWCVANGEEKENLIKNGDFEGEYDHGSSVVNHIEGWDVYPIDQYNSTQGIMSAEYNNMQDQNNHALWLDRYMWNSGWAAGEISQIVDVAPNEVYSLSALAKGGVKSDGTLFGSIRIYDLQNSDNKKVIDVTSDSWQTYATDFETLANTEQIRVSFYLERASWGASVSSLCADNVKLTGVSRDISEIIGFNNNGADVEYFAFDNTGAYAPAMASITASTDSLNFTETGEKQDVTVNFENLTGDISVSATTGYTVSPATIKKDDGSATLTISSDTYRRKNSGKVILRSGDERKYIYLTSHGSKLESKAELATKVTPDDSDQQTFDGFAPQAGKGYTVEIRAKVDDASKSVEPFAVSADRVGFKGYVTSTGTGLYNGYGQFVSQESMSNPSNGGTFYNTDGKYHTYRYAVTPDERVIVYRDGITIDSMRVADLASQPEWCVANGEEKENLIKNGDFEGEYDHGSSVVNHIEGWDVYPIDQYNSTQGIMSAEYNNMQDQNNHALWLDRYMWNAGWAAGEISQIVDVAPNEVYSLSALAKGGVKSDGTLFGSIRIYDLQNSDNKKVIDVTSDSWQTYATDFETLANTEQIRVSFYLERASWGASVSSLCADNVKLTGVSRDIKEIVGFNNNGADIEYFAFDNNGAYAPAMATITASADSLEFTSTGEKQDVTVEFANLTDDVTVSSTTGYSVSPAIIKKEDGKATLTISSDTYRRKNSGKIILRSGDERKYIYLTSRSSALETKAELANKVTLGTGDKQTFEGFAPEAGKGYTVEFRAKVDDASKTVEPFAVTNEGIGFKGYVSSTGLGLYNGYGQFVSQEGMSNPSNGGTFYNTDGLYHTYRYAVTPDERVIVYRDGITIDSLRVADLGHQPEWCVANGEEKENLIKNGDFEGEYDHGSSVVNHIEGWDVYPIDQYNSTQGIMSAEYNNMQDQNNHALWLDRYMWNAGWASAEISQIVDVAPNEVYSLSALAKGGVKSDGTLFGSIRIYDLQNSDNKKTIDVTSDSWQTYATDFETLANTEQIRVSFYLERASWGASVSSLCADNVKLTGVSRDISEIIGFNNNGADIEYFSFDNSGAYAPLMATMETSTDSLEITGTNNSATFTVDLANLTGDVSVTAPAGFAVSPTTIKAGKKSEEITVTNTTYRKKNTGKLVLRSGDKRANVYVTSYGSNLEPKDISDETVYENGSDDSKTFEGFNPGSNGYTVEVQVKVDDASKSFEPFAVSADRVGFKGYVSSTGTGLYNGYGVFVSQESMSNPSNGGTFYNTDGEYHTYRYAVTPDERVIVYRDGITIDSMRVADLASQPEWLGEESKVMKNLIRNSGFEGEYDHGSSVVNRIEGWDVYPIDQYNTTQGIMSAEYNNMQDQNNHALWIDRYMWNSGWAAGEISQIVDVVPNEVYSLSVLAKGGIKSDGTQLGSIRITDLQNSDNKVTIPVTSDSWTTYATDFETLANTEQVRVSFYLERASWGASVSSLCADNVTLRGASRTIQEMIGFKNNGSDIKYFAFDNTGAYAPSFPVLDKKATAIEEIDAPAELGISVAAMDNMITLRGVEEGSRVAIYSVSGTPVALMNRYSDGTGIAVPGKGTYIVLVEKNGDRKTIKVLNK